LLLQPTFLSRLYQFLEIESFSSRVNRKDQSSLFVFRFCNLVSLLDFVEDRVVCSFLGSSLVSKLLERERERLNTTVSKLHHCRTFRESSSRHRRLGKLSDDDCRDGGVFLESGLHIHTP
jgi:hypothetical protein